MAESKQQYLCEIHSKKYAGYCTSCNKNICFLCTSNHAEHDFLQFNEIQPSIKELEDLKQKFTTYKKDNTELINKMTLWLEKITYFTNKIIDILKNKETIYDEVLNNYDSNNLIYKEIQNLNEIIKRGFILGYKDINLSIFSNEEKILEKSELIIKTIKEMFIEELFNKVKNSRIHNAQDPNTKNGGEVKKNIDEKKKTTKKVKTKKKKKTTNDDKNETINTENTQSDEKKEDKKEKKIKKIAKKEKIKKENENNENKNEESEAKKEKVINGQTITEKQYEELSEINMNSNTFDSDFLINLGKNKKPSPSNNQSIPYKSVNTGSEVNHLCLIQQNEKKYIITAGYHYLNLYNLNGDLQRSLKIHESDITYVTQMKNGDLLTSSIDGNIKIIRLLINEGINIIQNIDTKKAHNENSKNDLFMNNQIFIVIQLKNENIITAHGNNLLIYEQTKNNKENYDLKQILPYNENNNNKSGLEMISNKTSIYSIVEIENNEFVASDGTDIVFFDEKEGKYIFNQEMKNVHCSGCPNNLLLINEKLLVGGNEIIYVIDTKEKKILNNIKLDCAGINCLSVNKNKDTLYIGYVSKNKKRNIGKYLISNEKNGKEMEIKEDEVYNEAHDRNIANIIPLEESDKVINAPVLKFISGSHDKYIKLWK